MTAQELLEDLTHRNVAVTIQGERLRIDAPRGVFTEELRRMLSERKSELMELIRNRSAGEEDGKAGERAERQIAAMPLDDFATAGLTVRVWSNVLDCEVLFVSDNVPDAELEGTDLPIYRTDELRKLAILRPRPRDLRRIHDVKRVFGGAIADVRAQDTDSDPAIPQSPQRACHDRPPKYRSSQEVSS